MKKVTQDLELSVPPTRIYRNDLETIYQAFKDTEPGRLTMTVGDTVIEEIGELAQLEQDISYSVYLSASYRDARRVTDLVCRLNSPSGIRLDDPTHSDLFAAAHRIHALVKKRRRWMASIFFSLPASAIYFSFNLLSLWAFLNGLKLVRPWSFVYLAFTLVIDALCFYSIWFIMDRKRYCIVHAKIKKSEARSWWQERKGDVLFEIVKAVIAAVIGGAGGFVGGYFYGKQTATGQAPAIRSPATTSSPAATGPTGPTER